MGVSCSAYGGEERDHLGDPGIDGRIIVRWILRKWDVDVSTAGMCIISRQDDWFQCHCCV